MVNNSTATVVLHEVLFRVRRSWVDRRPLVVSPEREAYRMFLPLSDLGWGRLLDPTFSFAILPDRPAGTPATYPFTTELHDADRDEEDGTLYGLSLEPYFRRAGVDVEAVRALERDGVEVYRRGESAPMRAALGPFAVRGSGLVLGLLEYGQVERDGSTRRVRRRVDVEVAIGTPGVGAPLPPSFSYGVELRSDGERYEVRVPVSHALRAGEADRFTVTIGADKASYHEFDLVLRGPDGVAVTSQPVALELFRSRADRNR